MARKSLSWEQKLGLTLLAETITPCLEHTRPGLKTTTLGSARAQHYEEQVTRAPIEQSYTVNGVEFDGYDGFALIDAKGPGYADPIKGGWSAEPEGKYGLLNTAQRQVKAVRATGTNTPIHWHIAEKETFNELWKRQMDNEFPSEIELIYTPPN